MPAPANVFTIQKDPPWIPKPDRASHAPSCSVYSDDEYQSHLNDPDMPEVPPLRLQKSYHARPPPRIADRGPQVRQSRLPIFRQVRSMLQKQPPLNTSNINRAQESTAPEVKHPSGKSSKPAFEVHRDWPESSESDIASPLSTLQDDGMEQSIPPSSSWEDSQSSPVSALSEDWSSRKSAPGQVSADARAYGIHPETPSPVARIVSIKRKAPPRALPKSTSEITPPTSSSSPPPSRDTNIDEVSELELRNKYPVSRFSWTTYAPSGTPGRPSFDVASQPSIERPSTERPSEDLARARHLSREVEHLPGSRFSWSTVNTGMPNQARPDSPPPSPQFVQSMPKHKTPPVQSILSRHRPIQRLDREEWVPQPRKASIPIPPSTDTPTSAAKTKLSLVTTNNPDDIPGSAQKSLPPPPDMVSPISPLTHLEALLKQEESLSLQRRNIEKAIIENDKLKSASPMDVSFAEVREAKKKLETLGARLEEIKLEERDVGIAISRARRKEGEEEGTTGLWIRRVTG